MVAPVFLRTHESTIAKTIMAQHAPLSSSPDDDVPHSTYDTTALGTRELRRVGPLALLELRAVRLLLPPRERRGLEVTIASSRLTGALRLLRFGALAGLP